MKESSYSKMSDEQLLKNRKVMMMLTGMLGGAILVLLVLVIIQLIMGKLHVANAILPPALLPILFVNLYNLKGLKKEIHQRGLSS